MKNITYNYSLTRFGIKQVNYLLQLLITSFNNFVFIIIGVLGALSIIVSYIYMFLVGWFITLLGDSFQDVLMGGNYIICVPAFVAQSAIAPVSIGNYNSKYIFKVSNVKAKKGLLITFGGNAMKLQGDGSSLEYHSVNIQKYFVKKFDEPLDHLLLDIKQAKDYRSLLQHYNEIISSIIEIEQYDKIIFHGLSMGGAIALSLGENYHNNYPNKNIIVYVENTFTSLSDVLLAYDLWLPYIYYANFWSMDNLAISERLENENNVIIYATGVNNDEVLRNNVFQNQYTTIYHGRHNDFQSLK